MGLTILVAGPYRSGTGDDPAKMAHNVRVMEAYALPLFRAGHVPIVGEWLALPLVALAGSRRVGDAAYDEIFHPIAERLVARCDAVLRVGGASEGADLMVRLARGRGLRVFQELREVPGCASLPEPTVGPPHDGYHAVTPRIAVGEPAALVEFLKQVFGAKGDLAGDRPAVMRIGDSLLMVGGTTSREPMPAFLYLYVDDTDATHRRALEAGAVSLEEPIDTPYGDRRGVVKDRWGNVWQIATRLAPASVRTP